MRILLLALLFSSLAVMAFAEDDFEDEPLVGVIQLDQPAFVFYRNITSSPQKLVAPMPPNLKFNEYRLTFTTKDGDLEV